MMINPLMSFLNTVTESLGNDPMMTQQVTLLESQKSQDQNFHDFELEDIQGYPPEGFVAIEYYELNSPDLKETKGDLNLLKDKVNLETANKKDSDKIQDKKADIPKNTENLILSSDKKTVSIIQEQDQQNLEKQQNSLKEKEQKKRADSILPVAHILAMESHKISFENFPNKENIGNIKQNNDIDSSKKITLLNHTHIPNYQDNNIIEQSSFMNTNEIKPKSGISFPRGANALTEIQPDVKEVFFRELVQISETPEISELKIETYLEPVSQDMTHNPLKALTIKNEEVIKFIPDALEKQINQDQSQKLNTFKSINLDKTLDLSENEGNYKSQDVSLVQRSVVNSESVKEILNDSKDQSILKSRLKEKASLLKEKLASPDFKETLVQSLKVEPFENKKLENSQKIEAGSPFEQENKKLVKQINDAMNFASMRKIGQAKMSIKDKDLGDISIQIKTKPKNQVDIHFEVTQKYWESNFKDNQQSLKDQLMNKNIELQKFTVEHKKELDQPQMSYSGDRQHQDTQRQEHWEIQEEWIPRSRPQSLGFSKLFFQEEKI
jgi:hypothetical protein